MCWPKGDGGGGGGGGGVEVHRTKDLCVMTRDR